MVLKIGLNRPVWPSVDHDSVLAWLIGQKNDRIDKLDESSDFFFLSFQYPCDCSHYCRTLERHPTSSTPWCWKSPPKALETTLVAPLPQCALESPPPPPPNGSRNHPPPVQGVGNQPPPSSPLVRWKAFIPKLCKALSPTTPLSCQQHPQAQQLRLAFLPFLFFKI